MYAFSIFILSFNYFFIFIVNTKQRKIVRSVDARKL